jgi:RNA polymerase sigma-70 factor (ECF subfamily)
MNEIRGAALAAPFPDFTGARAAWSLLSAIIDATRSAAVNDMGADERDSRDRNEEIAFAAVRGGDRSAYDYLVRKYMRKALSISWGIVRDPHDAEDLTQEAFVRAFQKIGSVKTPEAFAPWLYRIVTNLSLDHLRRRKRHGTEAIPESYAAKDRSDALSGEVLARRIDAAMETLPDMQRVVARLFLVEQFSHAEIAVMVGLNEGTVRSHLSHARRKLQQALSDLYEVAQ